MFCCFFERESLLNSPKPFNVKIQLILPSFLLPYDKVVDKFDLVSYSSSFSFFFFLFFLIGFRIFVNSRTKFYSSTGRTNY